MYIHAHVDEAEVNKKQSAYHSLLQSSVHSDVSDSLSEGTIGLKKKSHYY